MDRVRRYPSDLTDAEWETIEPMLPSPQWMGRPEKHPRRAIVDGILYVVRTGCAWRYLPVDFPPWQTVYSHFQRWNRRGVTERILTELREEVRLAHDRQPEPTAGIIDSQSVRAADTVHRDTRGRWWRLDAGRQALLALAHLRNGDTITRLAYGFAVSVTTAWRYVQEAIDLLAAHAEDLNTAMRRIRRLAYAILDGTSPRSTGSQTSARTTPANTNATG